MKIDIKKKTKNQKSNKEPCEFLSTNDSYENIG